MYVLLRDFVRNQVTFVAEVVISSGDVEVNAFL